LPVAFCSRRFCSRPLRGRGCRGHRPQLQPSAGVTDPGYRPQKSATDR